MRTVFLSLWLSLLLPPLGCGADAPPPVVPADSVSRTPSTNGLYVPDDGDPGGGNLPKCAAAECNDPDHQKDYVDPPPDDAWRETEQSEAQVARTRQ